MKNKKKENEWMKESDTRWDRERRREGNRRRERKEKQKNINVIHFILLTFQFTDRKRDACLM